MEVVFRKLDGGRHCGWTAHLPKRRPVPGSIMNVGTKRPPHDLVQLGVEAGLRLEHGFWGCIASGARFRSMPARRTGPGRAVFRDHRRALDDAEELAGLHVAGWSAGEATPAGPVLDRLVAAWWALPDGGELTVAWPSGAIVAATVDA